MEHPLLPTFHLDDVPRSMSWSIVQLADLTYHFGPTGDGFFRQDLQRVAEHLQVSVSSDACEDQVEETILDAVASRGSHVILILQIHPNPLEGHVCLLSKVNLTAAMQILKSLPIQHR